MSMFDLSDRVAVITGGNGGIGLAMAKALAQHGCAISIWGRSSEKNAAAVASLGETRARVHSYVCDVAERDQTEKAAAQTLEIFGRIGGCFANAGIGGGGRASFIERTEDDWRRMFAINLDGIFHVLQPIALRSVKGRCKFCHQGARC